MFIRYRHIAAALLAAPALAGAAVPVMEVFKSAACGCCTRWVEHLRANGLTVKASDVADPPHYRHKFGIPDHLGSCHTAKIGAYAIEGHVPASDIKRLLGSGTKARALAVPGMPSGSPGMEGARREPYDVLLVQPDGRTAVYQHHGARR